MVITGLLKVAATWATPDVIFLRSLRRGRAAAAGFAIVCYSPYTHRTRSDRAAKLIRTDGYPYLVTFFLPAMATALPLRVRALVCVRWPRTGRPLRCRRPR